MKNKNVEVICVGTELLYDRVNTDINIISGIMRKVGYYISRCTIVADDIEEIKEAVSLSLKRSDIVFITGGLGPTSDDLTREAISELLNRKLIFSENIWHRICDGFYKRGLKEIPEINKKQAYVIEGGEIIENNVGTAPGMIIKEGRKTLILVPGPPAELIPMVEEFAESLKEKGPMKIYRFGISGVPESIVEERIHNFFTEIGIKYTILASPQIIEIIIPSSEELNALPEIEKFLEESFSENYLGIDPPPLPIIIGTLLKEKKLKIALAESCTGGLAGKLLTDIPKSSEYFQGSFVVYNNILKRRILGVPKTVLKKYGAVSELCALYMAKGAKKKGKADVSISITGIAGPSGGTSEKPVGLVYIGIGLPKNKFHIHRFIFPGNRERIRERAVYQAFELLRKYLV
ncbi:MAG: CinA family nicotinamide mononucleotide deamidase-related protein [Candidatus Omnitrophica bacterium]|nr:CinA family nicotinamide mononucleotide deamidase-related protein [Candidatus Omnitrophota bacterium]